MRIVVVVVAICPGGKDAVMLFSHIGRISLFLKGLSISFWSCIGHWRRDGNMLCVSRLAGLSQATNRLAIQGFTDAGQSLFPCPCGDSGFTETAVAKT
ncbi:hypothetical protein NAV26_11495 [Pseudomonas stutzeri]|uniref:hypothetical protein n=1 Tax=Stutzerimonas stutzeri TaxID=316 RepID=UPI00210DB05F|nr:hypothetical protein [Stutzerimonas stutzeri]MCQ4325583.1 hypothetical protein [Stutzerimonas stutzeri]